MNIEHQQHSSQVYDWHRSLESVLSERKFIDAFRLWLRIQRKDDALDLYLAIIAFRKHARRNDQRASSVAFGICRRYISPRTGLSDFLPIQLRNDLTAKITSFRGTDHKPEIQLFDQVAPLVWAYLCEQHALFVCSKEFATILKSAEQGSNLQLKMAELAAVRNATANSRVPPLIGFGKFRVHDATSTHSHRHNRPRSEPPGRRHPRSHTNFVSLKRDTNSEKDQDVNEHSYPMIRHDRPEDREMFVQMICERLAGFNTNDEPKPKHNLKKIKAEVDRETDLTSDNDNEQRLIQRDFDCLEEDLVEPWDEENSVPLNVYDWDVNRNTRLTSAHNVGPLLLDQKSHTFASQIHKSASISFSDLDRSDPREAFRSIDSYNATFSHKTPFIKNQLYAVHKHLVAPLSNKYSYQQVSRERFPPPPPAPNNQRQLRNNAGTYQQFSDSSGFCSSESAHFQFQESEPRRHYWAGSRMPRENSFPFEGPKYSQTIVPNFCSPPPHNDYRHLLVTYKDDVTGVPLVAKLEPRPLLFRDFRKCFGIPSNSNKRFLFKSECEDGSAPYQLTAIINDLALLPVFEGKVIAECRSFSDTD